MIHPEVQCTVVTPERTVYDEPVEFIALTLYDGEIGIAPGRTPMIGRLGFGEMRITHSGKSVRYYIEGGFVEVVGSEVCVLTGRAIPATQLDRAVLEEQLATARAKPANTPELMSARDRAIEVTRGQLRVARRSAE